MSILKQTDPDKLIGHLRGEVGEIIQSWVILNIYDLKSNELQTNDIADNIKNENLLLLNLVRYKFRDDIISRLSELTSTKHGRLNFHFAADKFKIQKDEITEFGNFLKEKNLIFRRNKNIAHKQMSPKWEQIDPSPAIRRRVLVKAIGWTIRIMKKFDQKHLGEDYRRVWTLERKLRYKLDAPGAAKYMMLPYIRRKI